MTAAPYRTPAAASGEVLDPALWVVSTDQMANMLGEALVAFSHARTAYANALGVGAGIAVRDPAASRWMIVPRHNIYFSPRGPLIAGISAGGHPYEVARKFITQVNQSPRLVERAIRLSDLAERWCRDRLNGFLRDQQERLRQQQQAPAMRKLAARQALVTLARTER